MASPRRRARRPERGFSLTELLVMMAILGIAVAVALPGFRRMMEGYRHRGSVDRVTSNLFKTRQLAVRDKFPYVLSLDLANRQVVGFGDSNSNGAQDGGEPAVGPWQMFDDVSLVNVSWPGAALTFFPNGRASQTADLQVVDLKGRSRTVRVNSITGSTEVLP